MNAASPKGEGIQTLQKDKSPLKAFLVNYYRLKAGSLSLTLPGIRLKPELSLTTN